MVTLTLLADQDYLALARTSAIHVGALLFLPRPRVNDLCLAVDEACTSFLQPGPQGNADIASPPVVGTIEICYDRHPACLRVTVRAKAPYGWPQRDELGWAMLGNLVSEIHAILDGGVGALTLVEPLPTGAGG
jgi:hypothetical protein